MGDAYYNAALVVAASGAKDSREGLFVNERTISTVLQLPYKVTGEYRGAFNMTQLPNRTKKIDHHPAASPLTEEPGRFEGVISRNVWSHLCHIASLEFATTG
ncbi:hypothetical protein HBI70_149300 [Parastagonospora nodorum]|nr:hypothetical protein HBH53_052460 [Parastagonospora nodorum]KAH4023722.1 hypothetical protein HBI09_162940 [Parastagonospora nodorum]KAH4069699.1 hypothetical protein HBH50_102980 [Parastagonospora nodorum]KAH5005645.1 hypothetical protein HBI77_116770 [Parastagonospora nodorum]KAH5219553.1 hypothetical protein HBI62_149590 [Parastagonospora nodorum]